MNIEPLFGSFLLAQAPPGGPGIVQMLIPLVMVMGVFYFLIWRPQAKTQQKHQELLKGLKVGDDVVTDAGVFGKITAIDDEIIMLEISKGVKIRMKRQFIESLAEESKS